jgi:hypothetical protein
VINIFDANNHLVYQSKKNSKNHEIKTKHFSKGIYFVKIISDNQIMMKKIIVF